MNSKTTRIRQIESYLGSFDMEETLQSALLSTGCIAVIIFMACNGFASFPPSEIILCLAGVAAFDTGRSVSAYILSATIGNLVGALGLYYLARIVGWGRLHRVRMFLSMQVFPLSIVSILLPDEDLVERYQHRLDRGRYLWIMYGRCIPVIRSVISVPAALFGVRPLRFLMYTATGCLIWATFWVVSGYSIGRACLTFGRYASYGVALLLCILFGYLLHRAYNAYRATMG